MAGCLSPCPTDIVIQATGLAGFTDQTPHGGGGGYIAGGDGPKTFSWTIPAGITIGSVRFALEYTVNQGCPRVEYVAGGGSPGDLLISPPGSYSASFAGLLVYTGTMAPGNTISSTFQAVPWDTVNFGIDGEYNHPDWVVPSDHSLGVNYPSSFSDSFFFDVQITCFSMIITPACLTPVISIGSGDSATVCVQAVHRHGIPPQWILDGNKQWVIYDYPAGILVDSTENDPQLPSFAFHAAPPCNYGVIQAPCDTTPLSKTHKLGDYIGGPYTVEYLIDWDGHFDWDLWVCSQFIIVADTPCPNVGGTGISIISGGLGYGAIEVDSVRGWVHIGNGPNIVTYNTSYKFQFSGSYKGVIWKRLRVDTRGGLLVALGATSVKDSSGNPEPAHSIWVSYDGGQSARKVMEVASTSSVLECSSERGLLIWLTGDSAGAVSRRLSEDHGETWGDPDACLLDNGKPMKLTVLDTCNDCRAQGRLALLSDEGGVLVSDDAGLTFRQVV